MDRFGLFVDAGYLLAAGAQLCLKEKRRNKFFCDYEGVHRQLVKLCTDQSQLSLFRTYWYDGGFGSPHPQPTVDQLGIAGLPNVKLRLGRIIMRQQKGVDSMITRDLMTLAKERVMPVAFLLSGDEDLREAVVATQDLGVQVILLGITPVPGVTNQSFTLMNECDANVLLEKDFLLPFFSLSPFGDKSIAEPLLEPKVDIAPDRSEEDVAADLGKAFCESWVNKEKQETVHLVSSTLPVLPTDVDAPLLRHAEGVLGSLRNREELRKRVRQAFVAQLRRMTEADDQK